MGAGMNIIAAVNCDWGIGHNGTQSIVIEEDRQYFRSITDGGIVISGRKTFEDYGRPLPNRKNIVLSRCTTFMADGIFVANTYEETLAIVSGEDPDRVFIIGGGDIFNLFIPVCTKAYITKIDATPRSDTFFPNLDESRDWSTESQGDVRESNGIRFSFDIYKRNSPATGF